MEFSFEHTSTPDLIFLVVFEGDNLESPTQVVKTAVKDSDETKSDLENYLEALKKQNKNRKFSMVEIEVK